MTEKILTLLCKSFLLFFWGPEKCIYSILKDDREIAPFIINSQSKIILYWFIINVRGH